jgi:predicted small lipoprotein YifL
MNALFFRLFLLVATVASLIGCASYGPGSLKPGATVAETTSSMGPPTARYAMPGGTERLEYERGPAGLHTFMLDFDAAGRLTKAEQVLTEARFNAVPWGISREQVLACRAKRSPVGPRHSAGSRWSTARARPGASSTTRGARA